MAKRSSTEDFVRKARKVHGEKYDYSCTIYKTVHESVEYICPIHGRIKQEANSHLRGHGCPRCSYGGNKGNIQSTEHFVNRAREIHKGFYSYEKTKYLGWYEKVEIICPIHGSFWQEAGNHLLGYGCQKCGFDSTHNSNKETKEGFVKKAIKKFGDEYDYSLVDYKGCYIPIDIICKKHGIFQMGPTYHLSGHRCPKCVSEEMTKLRSSTTEEFVQKAKLIHGDKYDYSKVSYIDRWKPVIIICPLHGDFEQTPNIHLAGCGCPFCKQTKGESAIEEFLKENNIKYIKEYQIPNTSLFCNRKYLLVDFCLPEHNTFIEYNGQQHYYPVSIFGGKDYYATQVERDMTLRQYCLENKIKLIEIPYTKRKEINKILTQILTQKRRKNDTRRNEKRV